jgi:hypothetical protein
MRGPDVLAEGSTVASGEAIVRAFQDAFSPRGFKGKLRGKTRFRDGSPDALARPDRLPATATILAEMPNSPGERSYISIQLELWDRGSGRDYRLVHLGVVGPLGVSASKGEARKRAASFAAAL